MIIEWNQISEKYKDATLILGNGASIAFDEAFGYTTLYEVAYKKNYINQDLSDLFKKFETTNFELVLYRLWQAREVLNVLKANTDIIHGNYSLCRDALIKTVHDVHIKYRSDDDGFINNLERAAKFLLQFKTIFSLNYDLMLYWIIAIGNREGTIFKDCFWESLPQSNFHLFESNWSFLKNPQAGQEKSILIFYPHGNLTLARLKQEHLHEIDLKIVSPNQMHLDAIVSVWGQSKLEPVFISEGDYKEKKKRIYESNYLNNVYQRGFEEIEQSLVIYGWSIAEQDNHILQRIIEIQDERRKLKDKVPPISNIAVSIHQNGDEKNFIKHDPSSISRTPCLRDIISSTRSSNGQKYLHKRVQS
ncbi:DUF4917 family protein [Legionella septentrionalis]|uniref:DUF4917 family protein n=1 Tax=Legionella septentrionalis TaxID=2498109 RepID=UPI000F8F6B8D|nr:DUF4917 family protein [Legionella septentrionalis]RUR08556.1 DUF4917 family protein [Legionella septentrionalis]